MNRRVGSKREFIKNRKGNKDKLKEVKRKKQKTKKSDIKRYHRKRVHNDE